MVVMNDWIHGAHSLTKTSTTAVQTFLSPARGLVGIATYGNTSAIELITMAEVK